jgi:hypothetical protein
MVYLETFGAAHYKAMMAKRKHKVQRAKKRQEKIDRKRKEMRRAKMRELRKNPLQIIEEEPGEFEMNTEQDEKELREYEER